MITSEKQFKKALARLNEPDNARAFFKKINLTIMAYDDGTDMPIEKMSDEQVVQSANRTMKFAIASMLAITELADDA